jgi:hypothetical protein
MQKVMVYNFTIFDNKAGESVTSPRPAIRERIEAIAKDKDKGIKVLEDTAQEVEISRLDGNGFLKV